MASLAGWRSSSLMLASDVANRSVSTSAVLGIEAPLSFVLLMAAEQFGR
jgi:hypothetical protein